MGPPHEDAPTTRGHPWRPCHKPPHGTTSRDPVMRPLGTHPTDQAGSSLLCSLGLSQRKPFPESHGAIIFPSHWPARHHVCISKPISSQGRKCRSNWLVAQVAHSRGVTSDNGEVSDVPRPRAAGPPGDFKVRAWEPLPEAAQSEPEPKQQRGARLNYRAYTPSGSWAGNHRPGPDCCASGLWA